MKKKEAFQIGVIAVAAIIMIPLSLPLFKKGAGDAKKAKVAPTVSQPALHGASSTAAKAAVPVPPSSSPQGALAKLGFGEQVIKLKHIKDDKLYDRLSRAADMLPLDRDPFSFAYTGPKSSRDGLELAGILWEGDKPTAIIGQSFYNIGDSDDLFTVVSILQDRVVLKDKSGEFELRLKS
jgi:hypothetical protein